MRDVKYDVVLYADDPAGAFCPQLNASKPTGGTEVHLVQLAEGLAAAGLRVMAASPIPEGMSSDGGGRAAYLPSTILAGTWRTRTLITAGFTKVPPWVETDRHVALFTHLPQHNLQAMQHMRRTEIVCVSRYQASFFPFNWDTKVIPPIVDDWIYDLPQRGGKDALTFVCFSAAWKGGAETLLLWEQVAPPGATLYVGSPYGHNAGYRAAVERTRRCRWVDLASPADVVLKMQGAAGVFRVARAPETFGVTDTIAQILGLRTHVFTCGDSGGLTEALAPNPWVQPEQGPFISAFLRDYHSPPVEAEVLAPRDYRAAKVIPQWLELLDL